MFKRKSALLAVLLCLGIFEGFNATAQTTGSGNQKTQPAATKSAPASSAKSASSGTGTTSSAKPSAATPQKAAPGKELDINTATVDQLKALPGIGDAYAKRIVDGRPYTAKNQLTQKGILPQPTYDKIKDQIIARRGK